MSVTTFTDDHIQQLALLRKNGTIPHYVYRKIDALYMLTQNNNITVIAKACGTSRVCIYDWKSRFIEKGLAGLFVEKGRRGLTRKVDDKQLKDYVHQSPENFGISRTRWTLRLLADTVPCLKGMTEAGVYKALRRIGYSYKRGQPWQTSPDPEYASKKKRLKT